MQHIVLYALKTYLRTPCCTLLESSIPCFSVLPACSTDSASHARLHTQNPTDLRNVNTAMRIMVSLQKCAPFELLACSIGKKRRMPASPLKVQEDRRRLWVVSILRSGIC